MLPTVDEIELEPEEAEEYRAELALIEMHQRTARLLERDLYTTIRERHGIDLATENYELDTERGMLLRKADNE